MTPTPRQKREAFTGLWDWSQVQMIVRQLRTDVGNAWGWMTPRIQEALVAERCFDVCRGRHAGTMQCIDMDHLLAAMRFEAGLADWDEVEDWAKYAKQRIEQSKAPVSDRCICPARPGKPGPRGLRS